MPPTFSIEQNLICSFTSASIVVIICNSTGYRENKGVVFMGAHEVLGVASFILVPMF